jgi:hypothetical protein
MDGSNEGTIDGAAVGRLDGTVAGTFDVNSPLGACEVDEDVVFKVGIMDGFAVLFTVGLGDGFVVGLLVGSMVGAAVSGFSVGRGVGFGVGASVCSSEGLNVGALVNIRGTTVGSDSSISTCFTCAGLLARDLVGLVVGLLVHHRSSISPMGSSWTP